MINTEVGMLYVGTFADVDPNETNFLAENAANLVGATASVTTGLKYVRVTNNDNNNNGIIGENDLNGTAGDTASYDRGNGPVTAVADSSLVVTLSVTLADNSVISVSALGVQYTNGDFFVTEILNNGSLDGLSIKSVTVSAVTGANASGYFSNQSYDNVSIPDGTVEGTTGDDVIDGSYTGDPDGDKVDNNDGILPGFTGDADRIEAGGGNDSVSAGAGGDLVYGGTGNDTLDGGAGTDTLFGEDGDDRLVSTGDNDNLFGGEGADTFVGTGVSTSGVGNFTVFGGSAGTDNDTLDLTPYIAQGFEVTTLVKNPENNGSPGFNGQVTLTNPATGQTVNVNFTDIENVIVCFTPGTMIATPRGEVAVELLQVGDGVFTRDNGIQPIRWIGRRDLSATELALNPSLRPILIRAGALQRGLPDRDLLVSPSHRVLFSGEKAELLFEESEVLVAAKHLTHLEGVDFVEPQAALAYIHIMFDQHEVILSNAAWTESFQPGEYSLKGIGRDQRAEILTLFPELQTDEGLNKYASARRALKRHESALL